MFKCEDTTKDHHQCPWEAAWIFEIDDGQQTRRLCGTHWRARERRGQHLKMIATPDGEPLPPPYCDIFPGSREWRERGWK
ncbi:MAG: hypothetical protein JSV86_10375 [Gemmatimonadota bacterium]|nr:MAG: hypothetical protein JSV86_10375 [Gemmatimonadota bacterium]